MPKRHDRFSIVVHHDGSTTIPIGLGFTEADIPALVAAENAVVAALRGAGDTAEQDPARRTAGAA